MDLENNLFKNKSLVAIIICHHKFLAFMNSDNSSYSFSKQRNIVKFDFRDNFQDYCDDLYDKWVYPLNFTYSNRYRRLKSTIKYFKKMRDSRVKTLIRIYSSNMDFILSSYDEIIFDFDLPENDNKKTRRDFNKWAQEYVEIPK